MLDHSRLGLENKFFPNKITKAKKENKQLGTCSTLFLYSHFFAVVLHDDNVKLPETSQLHVLWRKCCMWSCSLFFRCRSFLPWWPLAFLIFSQPLRNVHVILQTKLVFFVFLSLALALSLLSTPMQTLKLSRNKRIGFVVVVFYL